MAKVRDLGLPTCQVFTGRFRAGLAERLRAGAGQARELRLRRWWSGGPGREVWDFYQGPRRSALFRGRRARRASRYIKKASDFAKVCGIAAVQTHCGFIPENPNDPIYKETVEAMRDVAAYCRDNGQNFRYETGQETPITLIRAIRTLGWTTRALISISPI